MVVEPVGRNGQRAVDVVVVEDVGSAAIGGGEAGEAIYIGRQPPVVERDVDDGFVTVSLKRDAAHGVVGSD